MAFLDRSASSSELAKRHVSVTFSDSSTIINEDDIVTPPVRIFTNDEAGNRVILPDPFTFSDDEYGKDDEALLLAKRKNARSQSLISEFRTHGINVPSLLSRDASKGPRTARSSSRSIKPLKFSSADGRAYGTAGRTRERRRSVHSIAERREGTRCSICQLERNHQEPVPVAGSRTAVIILLVGMNVVFLAATVFCVVWPVIRGRRDKVGCAIVPVALWLAFILVTASSWRVVKMCECPTQTASNKSQSKRRSSGPLFPKPAVWLDRSQQPEMYADSEATEA
ncbi:hypothetical protein DOTSEDRAFT_26700 [Dothistroma septosporum NZE10]|uniref:Uncharacterized protein n=1 Tax=Dothistroma septosporum (strain NZE10 / CBS 128990) TaxID=675120 RepID=N1PHC6_DOTSN|nr:hypothetical protein DOTSEDRAFT_26700 [Dothistroma septosporum NZE10]